MTSSMPKKYIDREGIEEMTLARKFHDNDRANLVREKLRLQEELLELKTSLGSRP